MAPRNLSARPRPRSEGDRSSGVTSERGGDCAGKAAARAHFLIRVAVVVAACVAVGTVVALTHATPSQPR